MRRPVNEFQCGKQQISIASTSAQPAGGYHRHGPISYDTIRTARSSRCHDRHPKDVVTPPPSPPAVTFNSPENKKLCHYCNFHFLNFPRFLFFVVCCSSRSLYAARYWPGMSTQHGQSAGHCQRFSSSSATETFLWHRQRRLRRWPSNCRKARVNSRRFSRDWMQKPEPNDQQRIGKGGKKENEKREKEREKGFSTSCGYALSST